MNGLDPTLLQLFADEARRSGETIAQAAARGETMGVGRVLGALRSAAALVGLVEVSQLADAAERRLAEGSAGLSAALAEVGAHLTAFTVAGVEPWRAEAGRLAETLARSGEAAIPRDTVQTSRDAVTAPRDTVVEPPGGKGPLVGGLAPALTRQSASMASLFRAEVELHGKILVDGLLAAEAGVEADLDALMRAAHSVKGAARVIGASSAVGLAHAMEELLLAARDEPGLLEGAAVDLLLSANDALQRAARGAAALGELADAEELSRLEGEVSAVVRGQGTVAEGDVNEGEGAATLTFERNDGAPVDARSGFEAEAPSTVNQSPAPSTAPIAVAPTQSTVPVDASQLALLLELSGELLVSSYGLPELVHKGAALAGVVEQLPIHIRGAAQALNSGDLHEVGRCLARLNEGLGRAGALARGHSVALGTLAEGQQRICDRLHHAAVTSKMRPIDDLFAPYPRMVRDLCRQTGKRCQLSIAGAETLVDRDVISALEAPLLHLLRNAMDHGLEQPEERRAAGKEEVGRLEVQASRRGERLNIVLRDDGRGIDLTRLRQRIVAKDLAPREVAMRLSDEELYEFLFLPGVTTAKRVSDLSGRGVGLDVVQQVVKGFGGNIAVASELGVGTRFTVTLPLTRSVVDAALVELAGELYAFDAGDVTSLRRVREATLMADVSGRLVIEEEGDDAGEAIPLFEARELLELPRRREVPEILEVVVMEHGDERLGLVVDRALEPAKLVQRPLDLRLGRIPGINGAALTPTQEVVLLLDGDDLRSAASAMRSGRRAATTMHGELRRNSGKPRILVVDDSPTVREELRQLLEGRGYDVDLAVDGMDGWAALGVQRYALLITDIDMPRLSGLELLRLHKDRSAQQPETKVPAMVISYRATAEDRAAGLAAGAQCYLAKSDIGDERFDLAVEALLGRKTGGFA